MEPVHHPPLTEVAQIQEMVEKIRQESFIAFDTEFMRESTFYPKLELVQIGTETDTWLIDVPAFLKRGSEFVHKALGSLFVILQDPGILKIVHSASGDQECLFTSFGVVATPTLDTEVSASLCGYGESVGLGNLLKNVLGLNLQKGHARTDWSARPLPIQQLRYAHADVQHLVELGKRLLAELESLGRKDWALKLSSKWENKALYEPSPQSIADRLARGRKLDRRAYGALVELVCWRERRVRELNVPRRWLADDQVLMDLAEVKPKDLEHLLSFRGLNRGEAKSHGQAILACIEKGLSLDLPKPLSNGRFEPPTPEEARVMDLLKCYVGIVAQEHKIAAKHLLLSDQVLKLIRSRPDNVRDLIEKDLMSPEAAALIGEEIAALLSGRRAVSVENGQIKIVKV